MARYARLSGYSGRMLYAVNQDFSTLGTELHDGDEVAFIPPVSGGVGVDYGAQQPLFRSPTSRSTRRRWPRWWRRPTWARW